MQFVLQFNLILERKHFTFKNTFTICILLIQMDNKRPRNFNKIQIFYNSFGSKNIHIQREKSFVGFEISV